MKSENVMKYKISPNPSLPKRGNGEVPAGSGKSPLSIKFSILHILCRGMSSNPTLEKGGKGGFSEFINLPQDALPSLLWGASSTSFWK
jgi:hypothetical protein